MQLSYNRIDDVNTVEENLDVLAVRQTKFEPEMPEGYNAMGQSTNWVTHGVMELRKFVRHADAKKNKMKPTNPNAHTYINGTDVETYGYEVTQNTFLQ